MRFRLCVVGRPRDSALAAAISEYEKRARRYWPLDVREVKVGKAAETSAVQAAESALLLKASEGAYRVVCDEAGKTLTSRAFADWIHALREQARDVALIIGGAFGVTGDMRNNADRLLALAPWTLPHELARLVLAEQLYRAGTILKGEPYHK